MGRLPEEFISQLKQETSIVDLFSTYADLKKRGRVYVCCCPFHAEKTPSCTIYPDTYSFYCFGCGEGGDVISFFSKIENMSYMEAIKTLAQRANMILPIQSNQQKQQLTISKDRCYEINRDAKDFYHGMLLCRENRPALEFLARHLINNPQRVQIVKKFGLGFAPDKPNMLRNYLIKKGYSERELIFSGVCYGNDDYFQNRIIFPVIDSRGNITGFAGRAIDSQKSRWLITQKTPVFDRKQVLFSINFAKKSSSKTLILAEDCLNAVAIYLTGFENVIALLDTNITFQLIKSIAQYANEVIITYPVNQTILNYFSEANLPTKTLNLVQMQSPENYIITYGAEKFRNLIANAKDANLIQLENCQNGLDLESKQDKNMILQNSIQVLAGIKNPLERDIYLVETAKKLNINPDNLRIQVNQNIQKKFKSQSKNASTRSLTPEELGNSKNSIG
ncbi:MAG: DNA primase [Oscillospiraceae bacterium]|nr:DNA primase [Oscillospiraceae bacterium]